VEIGPIPWSIEFAYAVGLFATDGCISTLANGYPSMSFSSKDRGPVELFCRCAGVTAKIRERRRFAFGKIRIGYEVGFSSVRLARWLRDIGIGPRKSLTIGALRIPDPYFFDAVRGLLDGDGSVARYTDSRGRHCFSLRFYSGSQTHLCWLRQELSDRLGVDGSLVGTIRPKGLRQRPIFQLQYGREASRRIAEFTYARADAPKLERKWIRWVAELESVATRPTEASAAVRARRCR